MKFRILLDNYYSYILFCVGFSLIGYFIFDKKISYGTIFILGLILVSDILFEKTKYLLNLEVNGQKIEITYLNKFLIKKKNIIEIKSIESTNYQSSKSILNSDYLIVKEKNGFILKFKILDKVSKTNVQEQLNLTEK